MELENIKLDKERLQAKAVELANKAAVSELESFYTGYDSPYKKALRKALENKSISFNLELPDIITLLNEEIGKKADEIVNTAIGRTFLPIATKLFTRAKSEIKLSEFLKEFISESSYQYDSDIDWEDFSFEYERKWPDSEVLKDYYTITISNNSRNYEISAKFFKEDEQQHIIIDSLPSQLSNSSRNMTISLEDGVKIEMPFTTGVLRDAFTMYLARLIMANTKIIVDVEDFEEWLFPERDNCHC
tara:strand:+ start:37900 stop:38634 length:735 start_codon:yes stop_codon:yes gene_type:complete